jgi:hypothetical protein
VNANLYPVHAGQRLTLVSIKENQSMRRWIAQVTAFVVLLLPGTPLAQTGPFAQQSASPPNEVCQPSKVHVKIKLITGETITGNSIAINKDEVKLCRKGLVQAIPGDQIREIKSRQTGRQRFRQVARVVGLTFVSFIAYGLIRASQIK